MCCCFSFRLFTLKKVLKNEQSRPKDAKKKCLALDIFNEKNETDNYCSIPGISIALLGKNIKSHQHSKLREGTFERYNLCFKNCEQQLL